MNFSATRLLTLGENNIVNDTNNSKVVKAMFDAKTAKFKSKNLEKLFLAKF